MVLENLVNKINWINVNINMVECLFVGNFLIN